jgi:hypothetical protein
MQVKITEAATKGGAAAEVFAKLGLNISEIARLRPSEQLVMLARAARDSQSPIATINDLFGELGRKGNAALMEVANNGFPKIADEAGRAADKVAEYYNNMKEGWAWAQRNVVKGIGGIGDTFGEILEPIVDGWDMLIGLLGGDMEEFDKTHAKIQKRKRAEADRIMGRETEDEIAARLREQAAIEKAVNARIASEVAAEQKKTEDLKKQAAERFKALGIDRSGIERIGAIFGGASAVGMAMRDRETVLAQQALQLDRELAARVAQIHGQLTTMAQRMD